MSGNEKVRKLVANDGFDLSKLFSDAKRKGIDLDKQPDEVKQFITDLFLQANMDSLTQLANRRSFDRAFEDPREVSDDGDVLFLIDLDDFKPINDNYGHPAGNAVLKEVSSRFESAILSRLNGAVRQHDQAFRIGGDEFAVRLRDCSEEGARRALKKICNCFNDPISVSKDTLLPISGSVAYKHYADGINSGEEFDNAVKEVDKLLYEAKEVNKFQKSDSFVGPRLNVS